MRVAILGGTLSLHNLLELIATKGLTISAVVLQKPDPHEDDTDFCKTCHYLEENKFNYTIAKQYTSQVHEFIVKSGTEVACLINCRYLIPTEYLSALEHGFIATHGSLLPEYRGFAPLNWAIINGKKSAGITLFKAVEEVDSGPVIDSIEIPIGENSTATEIFKIFTEQQPLLFLNALLKIQNKSELNLHIQNNQNSSYCCRRTPQDSEINWNSNALDIFRLIKASQAPYPLAYTYFKDKKLSILEAQLLNKYKYVGIVPGRVVNISKTEGYVDILCADAPIRISSVRYDNKTLNPSEIIKSLSTSLGINYSKKIIELQDEINNLKKVISRIYNNE